MPRYFTKNIDVDTTTAKQADTRHSQSGSIEERLFMTSNKRLKAVLARRHQDAMTKHQQDMIKNDRF